MDEYSADIEQDKELIKSELLPVFETIGKMFSELEAKITECSDKVDRLIGGFSDAIQGHERNSIMDDVKGKYGEELAPIDELYGTMKGGSFTDEIVDALMQGGDGTSDRDGFIRSRLDDAKGKYGKFIGMGVKVEPEATPEAAPESEPVEPEESSAPTNVIEKMSDLLGMKKK